MYEAKCVESINNFGHNIFSFATKAGENMKALKVKEGSHDWILGLPTVPVHNVILEMQQLAAEKIGMLKA